MKTTTDLYPYQQTAVEKLSRPRVGAMFMEMGVGKTRCAIELVVRRQQRVDRAIVYCPVSLKETWRHEILKHTDTRPCDINIFDDRTSVRNLNRQAFWHIIGIESMSASNRVALAAQQLTTTRSYVIVDESDFIKGHNAMRTRRIIRYSENSRYRLALTGTPISQGYQDLYAQMRFLSPKILNYGSFYSFAANHLEYSETYPGLVVRAHNTRWLAAKVQPYVYQITKEDAGLNLPQKLYDQRCFDLSREQWEAYERAKYEILMCAEEIDSYIIFQLFGALQQIVSGFWNRHGRLLEFPHSRVTRLLETVRSVQGKMIVWCKFQYSVAQVVEALAAEYGREAVTEFHGGIPERRRSQEEERWRREARFLVATLGTGGRGKTWNEAGCSIFYENEFKYANRLQAEDRNHRVGQTKRPLYVDILGACKIEQRIMASHAKKGDTVAAFKREVQALKGLSGKELKTAVAEMI